jgi:hypothetical protein
MSCRRCGSDNKLAEADLCPNCIEAAEFREQLTIVKAERDEFKAAFEELNAVIAQYIVVFEKAIVEKAENAKKIQAAFISGWDASRDVIGITPRRNLKELADVLVAYERWQEHTKKDPEKT